MRSAGAAGLAFLAAVYLAAVVLGLTAWVAMLMIGGLHSEISTSIPAWGFWPVLLLIAALGFLRGLFIRSPTS